MSLEISSRRWGPVVQRVAVAIAAFVLLASLGLVALERTWTTAAPATPRDAFLTGSTGTELMPLPVFQVLPGMFPEHFQPAGVDAGDWIAQFGFLREGPYQAQGLPLGFSISRHRPRSGSPSPTPFVGIACSLCHSARIRTHRDDPGTIVLGMGSGSLDFIAWVDAFKSAVLDERLTVDAIDDAYGKTRGGSLGLVDRLVIAQWLSTTRDALRDSLAKTDRPYGGADVRNAELMPNGPSRTQPFRNLVRAVLDLPAATDRALCKIPVLYQQRDREWGQFDGSVHSALTRSALAAIAIGATPDNLTIPDITTSVQRSIDFTMTLPGPSYAALFPAEAAALDPAAIERGKRAYLAACDSCHGHPEGDRWIPGARQGEVVPLAEIGTDPQRVTFRYYDELPDALIAYIPAKNPLRPPRDALRPGPLGTTRGYVNTPIHSAFARAPFLHNGSVMTLAELIHLEPRRAVVYRGDHVYDPARAGLVAPVEPDRTHYYRLDTARPGNGNAGHDYPWAYRGPGWDPAVLSDLLAYLKTI